MTKVLTITCILAFHALVSAETKFERNRETRDRIESKAYARAREPKTEVIKSQVVELLKARYSAPPIVEKEDIGMRQIARGQLLEVLSYQIDLQILNLGCRGSADLQDLTEASSILVIECVDESGLAEFISMPLVFANP